MCLQASLTVAFILLGGGFRSLINFAVVASWAFYFLTVSDCASSLTTTSKPLFQVLGLVILRVKEPMLERPYKTWIITPLVFCAVRITADDMYPTDRSCHPCAGVSVLALHAHHRSAFRGNGRAW